MTSPSGAPLRPDPPALTRHHPHPSSGRALGVFARLRNSATLDAIAVGEKARAGSLLGFWGGWWDSNPRQPEPQSGVLPLNYTHHRRETHQQCGGSVAAFILHDADWPEHRPCGVPACGELFATPHAGQTRTQVHLHRAETHNGKRITKNGKRLLDGAGARPAGKMSGAAAAARRRRAGAALAAAYGEHRDLLVEID